MFTLISNTCLMLKSKQKQKKIYFKVGVDLVVIGGGRLVGVRCMALPIVGCTLDWKFNNKIQSIGSTQSNPIEFVNAPIG